MLQRNVDGVAVMTFGIEEELVRKLVEREFPLVFVDAGPDLPNIRVLKVNYGEGIRQAVQHLARSAIAASPSSRARCGFAPPWRGGTPSSGRWPNWGSLCRPAHGRRRPYHGGSMGPWNI